MQPIAIRLDPVTRHNLEQVSRAVGVSPADLVAEAVLSFVEAKVKELVEKGLLILEDGPGEGGASQGGWNLVV